MPLPLDIPACFHLHSTMYLLNRATQSRATEWWKYLHSTMYLLNPMEQITTGITDLNLHSTMYLLNLYWDSMTCKPSVVFTFHYVSIKSTHASDTMWSSSTFTFHYVSIKSCVSHRHRRITCLIYIPLCIY